MGGQHHVPAALPPGKTRCTVYRKLGGPHGRSRQVRKISTPPGFDPQPVNLSLVRLSTEVSPEMYVRHDLGCSGAAIWRPRLTWRETRGARVAAGCITAHTWNSRYAPEWRRMTLLCSVNTQRSLRRHAVTTHCRNTILQPNWGDKCR